VQTFRHHPIEQSERDDARVLFVLSSPSEHADVHCGLVRLRRRLDMRLNFTYVDHYDELSEGLETAILVNGQPWRISRERPRFLRAIRHTQMEALVFIPLHW
jgi:hypothetical protein